MRFFKPNILPYASSCDSCNPDGRYDDRIDDDGEHFEEFTPHEWGRVRHDQNYEEDLIFWKTRPDNNDDDVRWYLERQEEWDQKKFKKLWKLFNRWTE